jgi:tetratricopeptide (TPR) repeat protein
MKAVSGLLLAAVVAASGACATPDVGRSGVDLFYQGRYEEAESAFLAAARRRDSNETLDYCRAGSAALARGSWVSGLHSLLYASQAMEDLTASVGESTAAVIGEEASKTWKGEPHERAMAAYYAGLCYYRERDWGNALAGFKNALLIDSDAADQTYRCDVPLYHLLQGRVHLIWGEVEKARRAFREASELAPENPYLTYEKNRRANVVIVADLGAGPERFATGHHGSVASFRPRRSPDVAARVLVDGQDLGRMAPALDVLREATTRGGREIEGILAGKAVLKDLTTAAGVGVVVTSKRWEQTAAGVGLILLGQAMSAEADTRHWETLPAEVHVWVGRLEPGRVHEVRLRFLDGRGDVVRGFREYRARVNLTPSSQILLYARSGPSVPGARVTTETVR